MKKNKIAAQFPNIFRFIPETKFFKKIIKAKKSFFIAIGASIVVSTITILGIFIVLALLHKNINSAIYLTNLRQMTQAKINFWSSITNKYEGYKDAYFQQAVLEYRLGNYSLAKQANGKALLLDPNFYDAKKLQGLLENK